MIKLYLIIMDYLMEIKRCMVTQEKKGDYYNPLVSL